MARLNGFRERRVVWRYALRNALAPSVQVFAQNIQYLSAGSSSSSTSSPTPGLGKELVDAVAHPRRARGAVARHPDRGRSTSSSTSSPTCSSCSSCRSSGPGHETVRERLRFLRIGHRGASGVALLALVLGIALFGPFFAPHAPDEPIGMPFEGPSGDASLGTDRLGRDVLSRVLWGGRSVLALAGLATLIAYAAGGSDRPRRRLQPLARSTRCSCAAATCCISFPALLFLLVLVTGAGTSKAVLVAGVAIVQAPLDRAHHPHGDARAVRPRLRRGRGRARRGHRSRSCAARSCRTSSRRSPPTSACASRYSIILVASVNFFGLGLQPPAADWALMISENRDGLTLNPWVILVPAAHDRAADDLRQPRRRRGRAARSGRSDAVAAVTTADRRRSAVDGLRVELTVGRGGRSRTSR